MLFNRDKLYTRKDVHQILLGKPLPETGTGNWLTGYVKVSNHLVIFANVGVSGKTGHDFPNRLDEDGNLLTWYGRPKSHSGQKIIKSLLHGQLNPHIFIRTDNRDPKFKFIGAVKIDSFLDGIEINTNDRTFQAIEIKFRILTADENIDLLHEKNLTFEEIFNNCIKQSSKSSSSKGLIRRLSGDSTLQEAGDLDGVTRERIRQKEAAAIRFFSQYQNLITSELNKIEFYFDKPLYLWRLEQLSDFFLNITNLITSIKSPLISIFESEDSKYHIEEIDKLIVFYPKSRLSFREVISSIKDNKLEDSIPEFLLTVKRLDVLSHVQKRIEKNAPKSMAGKIQYYLERNINGFNQLIKMKDLLDLISQELGTNVKPNELQNVLSRKFPQFCQFDQNLWGTEEKFGISDIEVCEEITNSTVELLHDEKRFVHVSDLFQNLALNYDHFLNQEYIQKLTPYHIDWCLKKFSKKSHNVINHGKGRWESNMMNPERESMKIVDIVIDFLEASGKPQDTKTIYEHISSKRQVSKNFQLRPSTSNKGLVLLKPALWGLRNRDLNISADQEANLVSKVLKEFSQGKHYLNEDDITRFANEINISKEISFFQYSRLLLCHTSSQPLASKYFYLKLSRADLDRCFVISIASGIKPSDLEF